MDELEINPIEIPEVTPKKIIEKPNLYDKYFEGSEKLWENTETKLIEELISDNKIIGRKFLKNKEVLYLEIFENSITSVLGMSKNITLLYIPNEEKKEEFNKDKCIGFRYYENSCHKKCKYHKRVWMS